MAMFLCQKEPSPLALVHGGGPDIEQELKNKKIESKFKNGLRVTDKNTMDVVKMVLVGKTNTEIVNMLNMQSCNAIGLSRIDDTYIDPVKQIEHEEELEYEEMEW